MFVCVCVWGGGGACARERSEVITEASEDKKINFVVQRETSCWCERMNAGTRNLKKIHLSKRHFFPCQHTLLRKFSALCPLSPGVFCTFRLLLSSRVHTAYTKTHGLIPQW